MLNAQNATEGTIDSTFRLNIIQISLDITTPQGEFNSRMDERSVGGSYNFFRQFGFQSKWFWGANLDWHRYYTESVDFGGIEERRSVSDVALLFIARYYPTAAIGRVEPYVSGFAGPRVIYTNTNVIDSFSGSSIEFSFDRGGLVLDYGVGLGCSISLSDFTNFINLEANYHLGSSTTFDRRDRDAFGQTTGLLTEINGRYQQIIYKIGYSKAF